MPEVVASLSNIGILPMDLFTNIYILLMSPLIADAKANQSSAKLGLFVKNPPKIRLRICEIVKLARHTCASNSLTNFEYQVNPMTGNGNHV